jgi:hypothetical protein
MTTTKITAKWQTICTVAANPTLSAKVTEMVTAKQGVGVVATPKVADPADTKTREGLIFNWDQWHKK